GIALTYPTEFQTCWFIVSALNSLQYFLGILLIPSKSRIIKENYFRGVDGLCPTPLAKVAHENGSGRFDSRQLPAVNGSSIFYFWRLGRWLCLGQKQQRSGQKPVECFKMLLSILREWFLVKL